MSKQKSAVAGKLVSELFQTGVYKRSQGRWSRQVTFAAIAILVLFTSFRLYHAGWLDARSSNAFLAIGISFFGLWAAFRLVNVPQFADFLIAVEAEMNKVSWPTWPELFRASIVVIFVIFSMAIVLFGFDVAWQYFFSQIGIVYTQE